MLTVSQKVVLKPAPHSLYSRAPLWRPTIAIEATGIDSAILVSECTSGVDMINAPYVVNVCELEIRYDSMMGGRVIRIMLDISSGNQYCRISTIDSPSFIFENFCIKKFTTLVITTPFGLTGYDFVAWEQRDFPMDFHQCNGFWNPVKEKGFLRQEKSC